MDGRWKRGPRAKPPGRLPKRVQFPKNARPPSGLRLITSSARGVGTSRFPRGWARPRPIISFSSLRTSPIQPAPLAFRVGHSRSRDLLASRKYKWRARLRPHRARIRGRAVKPTNPQFSTKDLTWLDAVDPEIESRLLPWERAVLTAIRKYRHQLRRGSEEVALRSPRPQTTTEGGGGHE